MEDLVNHWSGRRVFITGHTGFKGSWLALWMARRGAIVRGFALSPDTDPNLFSLADVAKVLEHVQGDIRDYNHLASSLTEFDPEVVFHLAAQPLVRQSYADPLGTYATNVLGTANVLESVRHTTSVRAVVCVTTDKCYQNKEWIWPYRETDRLGGYDPYSSSKACAEMVTAAYRSSFFATGETAQHRVRLATARAGNVIGGGDWSQDRLIPDLIKGFCSGHPIRIRRPQSIRPWQHVLESLCGYITLAEFLLEARQDCASAFNFGPGDDEVWTVEQIADHLSAAWGHGVGWVRDPEEGVHEARMLRLDSSKARAQLGWRPRLNTRESIQWTLEWYQRWHRGENMRDFTLGQIERYEGLG